jgi:acetyl/propionyl-CoA carboxylase alpha subunit
MELIAKSGARVERISIERRAGGPHAGAPARYRIAIGGRSHEVDARALGPFVLSLLVDGESHEAALFRDGERGWRVGWRGQTASVELVDPLTHLAAEAHGDPRRGGRAVVAAYMPGRVVSVAVAEGQAVEPGQPLVVLEAMKMQNEIQADRAGTVTRVHVASGQAVEGGDPLVELA